MQGALSRDVCRINCLQCLLIWIVKKSSHPQRHAKNSPAAAGSGGRWAATGHNRVNLAKGFGGRYSELYTTGAWTQVPSALVTLSGGKRQRPPEERAGRSRARSESAYVPNGEAQVFAFLILGL